ncbi:ESPR-type extended signal peptide-containing protein [Megasphaera sp.]|uniref:ESPR-type extended signal peptide-containing protein n=1 Tax=Megasphaera sp. TaxID=2023260 RepID=UPI0035210B91
MNKIYKVVWNKARNCYVVASEFAKNHQTGSSRIKAASVAAVMAATMLTIGTGVIYAANVEDTGVKSSKETILFDNTTDETTKLNDPNLKHYNPYYEGNGHTDKCGELTYNTTLTIGDLNKVADALVANDNLLYKQGIQKVTMEDGTISLIRNDGNSVQNNITLTGNDGTNGQDTSVTVTVGDKSQTFQTGSVVTANTDTSGKATGLTINGTSYDIKDTTYSAGDNVTIDNNKISVDLSKYAKSDDVAVVYQNNDTNKSLHSTNAGTVGSSSIALGKEATTGMDSVALGDQTKATGQSSTAIGRSSQATAENAVALGAAAKVNVYGGVALGTSSVADREAGRATGEKGAFAPTQINETAQSTWTSTEGAVSVGDTEKNITRQITHVAAGSEDTDAVNVAQLKQVNSKADSATETANKGWNLTTAHGGTTTVKPGDTVDFSPEDTNLTVTNEGTNVKIGLNQDLHLTSATFGDTIINANGLTIGHGTAGLEFSQNRVSVGGQQIHDVADGKDDMDAVNVSQLKGVKSIANKGWNLTTAHGKTTTVKPGDTVDFSPEDTNLTVTNEGTNVKIGLNQDLHLTSATFGDTTINANGLTIGHGTAGLEFSKNRVSVGGQQIHDVADGKDDMDAVNMSQLKKAADSAKTTVVAGKNIKVNEDTKEDGHTEYNVSLDDDITLGGNEPNNFVTVSGTKGTIWAGHSVSAGTVIMDGDSGTITGLTNTTWNGTTDNLSRAATEGQLKQVADAATSNDKRLVQNPNDSDGSYQVKENGDVTLRVEDSNKNGYNVTIKNVASKAELDKVKTDVGNVDGFHDEIKNKDTNGKPTHTSVVDAVNNLDTKVNTIQSDVTKATEEAKKHSSVSTGNGLDLDVTGNNGQKDYKVSLKDDFTLGGKDGHTGSIEFKGSEGNITASGTLTANAVRVGNTSISDTGLQIGNNKTSLTEDALTIGGNTYITDKGIDANQQKISNVADGSISKDSKDAVNGSQLYATNEAIVNNYNNITNLNGRINNLDNRVNKVGAGAAALAALHPLDFDPDAKWDFAAGYGNYRGANAAAVGAYYRPNEDTMFSVGGTFGNGENMVNAGVSFKLGSGSSHVSTSRVAMAKEIKELRGELEAMKSAMLDANAGKKIDTSKLQLFPDVPQNHWAYEYVAQLAGNGMIEGYPDGNFAGDRPMTRYEFAAILYRAMTKGAVLSDKILSEFSHELEYFTVDTIAKDKAGNPTIQRVRTVKENKNK